MRLLLSSGAAVCARTHSSARMASELCTSQAVRAYLRCMEECTGVANGGRVYSVRHYATSRVDELSLRPGQALQVLRRGDYPGSDWWWCVDEELSGAEGYVLRDLLALHRPSSISVSAASMHTHEQVYTS